MNEHPDQIINKSERKSAGILYKFLRLFTVIHPGKGFTAFLLTLNVYILLAAYYINLFGKR